MEKLGVSVRKSLNKHAIWSVLQKLMVLFGAIFLIVFNFTKEKSVSEQFRWLSNFNHLQTTTRLSMNEDSWNVKFSNGLKIKVDWVTISDDYELQMALELSPKALKIIRKAAKEQGYFSFRVTNELEPLDTVVTFDAETVTKIKQTYALNSAGYYEIFTSSTLETQFWGYNRMLCRPLVWLKLKALYLLKLSLPAWLVIIIITLVELGIFVLFSHLAKYLLCLIVTFLAHIIFPTKYRT